MLSNGDLLHQPIRSSVSNPLTLRIAQIQTRSYLQVPYPLLVRESYTKLYGDYPDATGTLLLRPDQGRHSAVPCIWVIS